MIFKSLILEKFLEIDSSYYFKFIELQTRRLKDKFRTWKVQLNGQILNQQKIQIHLLVSPSEVIPFFFLISRNLFQKKLSGFELGFSGKFQFEEDSAGKEQRFTLGNPFLTVFKRFKVITKNQDFFAFRILGAFSKKSGA